MVVAKVATKAAAKKPMTAARKASRQRDKERKALKRAYAKAQSLASQASGETRKQLLQEAAKYERQIQASYYNKQTKSYTVNEKQFAAQVQQAKTEVAQRKARARSNTIAENARFTQMRKNEFAKAKLTDAQKAVKDAGGKPELTKEQRLARAESDFFYQATRELWLGGNVEQRNENIVAAMKGLRLESGKPVENLEDAFQYVKEHAKGKVPTEENIDEFDFDEQESEGDSPPPISLKQWRACGAQL